MPAPKKNKNARKGDENRIMWARRFPRSVISKIQRCAAQRGITTTEYIIRLVDADACTRSV